MPEFLTNAFAEAPAVHPLDLGLRLLLAALAGAVIAWVHRATRRGLPENRSFFSTLVLLCILIAMVTQVVGDSVARAFSLVGALSIVRFRTALRDTEDTAYVLCAVVVGMAIGAQNLWGAAVGMAVVASAAWLLMGRGREESAAGPSYALRVRIALGFDLAEAVGPTLRAHLDSPELTAVTTARQGSAIEATYRGRLRPERSADRLVRTLLQIDGVQDAQIERREEETAG